MKVPNHVEDVDEAVQWAEEMFLDDVDLTIHEIVLTMEIQSSPTKCLMVEMPLLNNNQGGFHIQEVSVDSI